MGVFAGPNISEDGLVLALDAGNKKSYSQNEFQSSTDIFGWFSGNAGGVNAATVSRDTINSPVGNTPLRMDVTGNDPHLGSYNAAKWNIAPALNGERWIVSVYAKANVATTGEILIFGANSSGAAFVNGGWLSLTGSTVNIGTEWTRVQHAHTMNSADVAFIHMRLDGPNSGGTGQTVWWDGLQVERVPAGVSTPTPFNSFYTGANTIRDLSGSANNGTLTNRPLYNNSNGGNLVFDGVNDEISFGGSTRYFTSYVNQQITIETWIYVPSSATWSNGFYGNIVTRGNYGGSHGLWRTTTNNQVSAWFRQTGAFVGGGQVESLGTITRDTWHQLVAVWKNPGSALYINGQLVSQNNTALADLNATATDDLWYIGRNTAAGGSNGNFFTGNQASTKIYNRALTAAEIQQNFNATRGRFGI